VSTAAPAGHISPDAPDNVIAAGRPQIPRLATRAE